jgi:lysozyme
MSKQAAKSETLSQALAAFRGAPSELAAWRELERRIHPEVLQQFFDELAAASKVPGKSSTPTLNERCVELIKHFEGFRKKAYPDPGTHGEPFTIGYGTTVYPNGKRVRGRDVITPEQGEEFLRHDLQKFAAAVTNAVKVALTDNQYSALVSFTYNVGAANLKRSKLLQKLNQEDYLGAADQFLRWNRAAGKVLPGLTERRVAERTLFLTL